MPMIRVCILLFLVGFMASSCVKRYYLEEHSEIIQRIVVDAVITDQDTLQKITLSKTASPERPSYVPLSGCSVTVTDIQDNRFTFEELEENPGVYEGVIPAIRLQPGNQFKLNFITSNGKEYESEYEKLTACPPIDSVYYEVDSIPTADPDIQIDGLRFYLDLDATGEYGRYYRWQLEETWEYHSTWPVTIYYAGRIYIIPPDYSYFYCYKTMQVKDFFILSTSNLVSNRYKRFRLHFVDNLTQKLMHKYSLLVKQYSITEKAYAFWNDLSRNNQESGGLFEGQPVIVRGNVINRNDPDEIVLGYFGVSAAKTKRIILSDITELSFENVPFCDPRKFEERLQRFTPDYWPVYLLYYNSPITGKRTLGIADPECFDCRLLGGKTEKPDYWDEHE
jgi:hypothetical protein